MSDSNRFNQMLRWYPPYWRSKYGEGMAALLEDTYGTGRVPMHVRLSLVKSGSLERAREVGFIGSTVSPLERQRAGSLLVLCGWGAFMFAGALFAKFTDNWGASQLGQGDRVLVMYLYRVVQWTGAAGVMIVFGAAIVALPSLIRLLRSGGWVHVRRSILRAMCAGAIVVVTTAALVTWAYHLTVIERNGGLGVYGFAVAVWSLTVSVAVVIVTSAAVSTVSRLELPRRTTRWLSTMAVVLTSFMFVILAGMLTWWSIESVHEPAFLRNAIGNGLFYTSSEFPLTLVIASLLMSVGLCAAVGGTIRVIRARRDDGVYV